MNTAPDRLWINIQGDFITDLGRGRWGTYVLRNNKVYLFHEGFGVFYEKTNDGTPLFDLKLIEEPIVIAVLNTIIQRHNENRLPHTTNNEGTSAG